MSCQYISRSLLRMPFKVLAYYRRLLSTDPEAAKEVVLAEKPVIADTSSNLEPALLDVLLANLSTLSSVYHKPPEVYMLHMSNFQHAALQCMDKAAALHLPHSDPHAVCHQQPAWFFIGSSTEFCNSWWHARDMPDMCHHCYCTLSLLLNIAVYLDIWHCSADVCEPHTLGSSESRGHDGHHL